MISIVLFPASDAYKWISVLLMNVSVCPSANVLETMVSIILSVIIVVLLVWLVELSVYADIVSPNMILVRLSDVAFSIWNVELEVVLVALPDVDLADSVSLIIWFNVSIWYGLYYSTFYSTVVFLVTSVTLTYV
jgi:hypothetical protein